MTARNRATLSTRRERRAQARAERALEPRRRTSASAPRWWSSPFVLVTIAAVVVTAAVVFLATRPPSPTGDGSAILVPGEPVPAGLADGQALGRADAPVVLEVYSDYQCPVCGRFAREYLSRLITDFVTPGQLRIVDRPVAILGTGAYDESVEAAVGAVCAGRQGRYWEYHALLMANQAGENEGAFRREVLRSAADRAGVPDLAAWEACGADPAVGRQVRADTAAAGASGIRSTPTFVLNGQRIVGLVAYDELAGAIATAHAAAIAP